MKKKFSRILGVGLTVSLLTSLLVMGAPASAGTLAWGAEYDPSNLVENTLLAGSDIVAIAASGDTVYAGVAWSEPIQLVIETAPVSASAPALVTVTYVDQDGNTAQAAAVVSINTTPLVGDTVAIPLTSPDAGVREVTLIALTGWTSASTGNITVQGVTSGNALGNIEHDGTTAVAAAANQPQNQYPLYKSSDGGATWSSLANTTSFPTGVYAKAVAIAPDDENTVAIITTANEVEYSTTGGASWTDLNMPSDTDPVVTTTNLSAIDISPGATRYLAVGGQNNSGSAELFTIYLAMAQTWQARYTGAAGIDANHIDMPAVRFSPNFATDKAIAVITSNSTTTGSKFQIFRYETGDLDWNASIDYLPAGWGTGLALTPTTATSGGLGSADIALPASFLANDEGERLAFISVAGGAAGGGVMRLTDTVQKDFQTWSGGDPGRIGSIAYDEAGKLIAGVYNSNTVYQYLSPMATTPKATRVNTLKLPGGVDKTVVAWSGGSVIAGTSGDESAVAVSTDDGYSFNDVGLIDTRLSVIDDVAVSADGSMIYLTTHDTLEGSANYDASVWLKASAWTRIKSDKDVAGASASFLVRVAPDDDTAVYISSKSSQDMWVSKNSGKVTWKHVPVYKVTYIQDFAVESADVVYALDTATGQGVSKTSNAGASWGTTKEPTETFTGNMITLAPNNDVLIGGSSGYVAFSKDGGATFERTKVVLAGSAVQVVADDGYADNNIIYATAGYLVKRGKADTTTAYGTRGSINATYTIKGIAQVGDITYVLADDGTNSRLYMSLKLETAGSTALAEWSSVFSALETYTNTPQALKVSISDTKVKLWAIDTDTPKLESYTDPTSMAGPALVSPDSDTSIAVNPGTGRSYDITFIWNRYSDSDIDEMQIQIATDSAFDAVIYDETFENITTDTIAKVIGPSGQTGQQSEFMPGETYYWRVRNGEEGPMYSPWSDTRSFTVDTPVAFAPTSPAVGATDVSTSPTLVWAAYAGAIHYEITVSKDADFTFAEYSHNVPVENTFYLSEELDYATTYYWKVRGITGPAVGRAAAPGGPWTTGVFTTMAEPVAETPPVVVEQPGKTEVQIVEVPIPGPVVQQAIPDYLLWVIVVIGAVLIVALIVLIVRTRRVA